VLEQIGRLTYRYRWPIILFWLVMLGAGALFAPRITSVLRGGGYSINSSQSVSAYNVLDRSYKYRALTFTVVFTGKVGALDAEARHFRARALAVYRSQLSVTTPIATPDHKVVFLRIFSEPQQDLGAHYAGPLRAILPHGAVRGYLAGPSAIFHDMETVSDQDLRSVEVVTLPIAAIVLLLIFGSAVAALVPVLMAPVAVTLTLALIYFIGHRVDMSIFVLNTASMLGLGVAIDYSLLMVNRYREELAAGHDLASAVGHTVATAGRAVLVSALVVSTGFMGMTLSGISMLSSLGIGGSLVTAISLLVALTFLPALLGILGPSINRLSVIPSRLSAGNIWRRIAVTVMRMPVRVIAAVAAIVLFLAIPAFHLRVGIPGPEILPPSVDSRAGNDILQAHLGLANQSPVLAVIVRAPGTAVSTARTAAFTALDRICASPDVAGVSTVPVANAPGQIRSCQAALNALTNAGPGQLAAIRRASATRRVALISVFLHSDPSSASSEHYVRALRRTLIIPGYRVLIGGQTAGQMDFDNYLYARFPLVAGAVVAVIFLVLLAAFRSLLLPLKAVLMNVFSVLAAYGVVTFAFQDGHLARILGFTPVGNIDSIVPVFLFCVLFGVSTDYEVFLLTRVQEEYRATGDNEESIARGLQVTGRIITSAAAVMIIIFVAFSFARLVIIKEVGLGLAAAVLIDATLVRALLVPATMRLLGRWNWWLPGRGFMRVTARPAGQSTVAR